MTIPATLSYQQAIMPVDPGAIAAAESVKARIQSAYVMAMQRPRNEDQARSRILSACQRPEFAERVEYKKPQGKSQNKETGRWEENYIIGPSIRFAELAVREWGNVLVESQVVHEDDKIRRIKVTILDLETNATFGKEIQVQKIVERKSSKGRDVVGQRTNSYGDPVFIVIATDDELHNKEAAMISKVIRNEGLRLIPSDIVDEAITVARKTRRDRDAKDPKEAKKRILDAFDSIGVQPKEIEKLLGHSLDTTSPKELEDLRGIFAAIKSGEATWADYTRQADEDSKEPEPTLGAKAKPQPEPTSTPQDAAPTAETLWFICPRENTKISSIECKGCPDVSTCEPEQA